MTPLTELLACYRRLSKPGNCGLSAHLAQAQRLAQAPAELAALFEQSLDQFAPYSNPMQFFHSGEISGGKVAAPGEPIARACAPVKGPPPEKIRYTVHFAQWLYKMADCETASLPELAFSYIDRELDCLRTSPGQLFEDGTPSKRALVLDLLLKNKMDGTPILAELKIRDDEDPLYGLIQSLCAAAHLATESQRTRLRNVYGLTSTLRDNGAYFDLYVIFFEPNLKGLWPAVLKATLALRDGLMKQPSITNTIRRIEFLLAALGNKGLEFFVAKDVCVEGRQDRYGQIK